jgi:hypothetical protein
MFSERVPLAVLRRLFGGLVSHPLIFGLALFSHFEMLGFLQEWSYWGDLRSVYGCTGCSAGSYNTTDYPTHRPKRQTHSNGCISQSARRNRTNLKKNFSKSLLAVQNYLTVIPTSRFSSCREASLPEVEARWFSTAA